MDGFTNEELSEALRAITSALNKSQKAQLKLKEGTSSHAMTARGIRAYIIAAGLLINEMGTTGLESPFAGRYTDEELEDALAALASVVNRVEKVLPRLNAGTPQHTLAMRRIKAFNIAVELIKRDLSSI